MCESNRTEHIIIPPAVAQEIVARGNKVYLRDCVCRVRQQACPPDRWQVCLLFEHAAEEDLRDARPIAADEALSILRTAAELRLVNHLFYTQAGRHVHVTEICSCCTCCCTLLRRLKQEGSYHEQLQSGYVAVTDTALCMICGLCLDSCFFEARSIQDGELHLVNERCFGCGRCVEACPEGAIKIDYHTGRGVSLPHGTMPRLEGENKRIDRLVDGGRA